MKLILEERGERSEVTLEKDEITIGRTADNAIRVADALSSRHHCRVAKTKDGFIVEDLKSRNGTTLNGLPLTERKILAVGDRIGIGESIIHFGAAIAPAGAAPAKKPAGAAPKKANSESARARTSKKPRTRYALKVQEGSKKGAAIMLDAFPVTIGKRKSCTLVFEDEGLADEHCMLVEDDGALHIVDLGSASGTLHDGKPVKGREKLKHGSVVKLGGVAWKLKDLEAIRGGNADPAASDHDIEQLTKSDAEDEAAEKPEKAEKAEKPEKPAPKEKPVSKKIAPKEVDLDAIGDEETGAGDDAAPKEPAKPKAPQKPQKTSAKRGKDGAVDADAAVLVAQEADVTNVALGGDVARLDERGAGGAIAAVVVVIFLLATLGAGVPAASALLKRPDHDPALDGNLCTNWSFEDGQGLGGWDAEGALTQKNVRHGRRAVELEVSGARPRAELRTHQPMRVDKDALAYVARAALRLDGRLAAGIGVEWTSEVDPGFRRVSVAQVVERASGWRDVGGPVAVPLGTTHARVVVFACSTAGDAGTLGVDRIRLVQEKVAEGEKPKVAELARTRGPAGIDIVATPRGVMALVRGEKTLGQWIELALGGKDGAALDPVASQSAAQLLAATADPGDGGLTGEAALLDPATGARVPFVVSVRPQGSAVRVRYELAKETLEKRAGALYRVTLEVPRLREVGPVEVSDDSGEASELEALFQKAGKDALRVERVAELSFGKDADQASLRLAGPATLEAHRKGESVVLTLIAKPVARQDGQGVLGFDLARASTGARARVQRLLDEAETAKKDGRLEVARRTYERIAQEFRHEEALSNRARQDAASLGARAQALELGVTTAAKDAEDLGSEELLRAARRLSEELEKAFPSAVETSRARTAVDRAAQAVGPGRGGRATARARELVARAQRYREQNRLRLARAVYEHVIKTFAADDPVVKEAKDRLAAMPAPSEAEE